MSVLRLAAAGLAVARPAGTEGFRARLDEAAQAARAGGADLLLMAEYFSMEVAAGAGPDAPGELLRAVELADALVAAARDVAQAHALWLLPGSFAMQGDGVILNRAPLIAPDGTMHWTEKHRMTRFESEEWGVSPGGRSAPIATPWGKLGVAICYDVEFPPITRALAEAGAFLILVPACTETMAGATRVEVSARACAIQNQCYVAVAPTLGQAPWSAALDRNSGRAAVFCPADRGFPEDGVLAAGEWHQPGIVFAELDPARLDAVRRDGAVRNFSDWP
jgi:predicted amidohydrolase